MVFGNEGIFFVSQTQETAKAIIALADKADASMEQNTSSSRQGLSVYRLRCHCCEIYIVYTVTLPITDIVY